MVSLKRIVPKIRPALTDEIIEEFQKDCITYSRGCGRGID
jgi:hypothetical protein